MFFVVIWLKRLPSVVNGATIDKRSERIMPSLHWLNIWNHRIPVFTDQQPKLYINYRRIRWIVLPCTKLALFEYVYSWKMLSKKMKIHIDWRNWTSFLLRSFSFTLVINGDGRFERWCTSRECSDVYFIYSTISTGQWKIAKSLKEDRKRKLIFLFTIHYLMKIY